MKHTVMLVDDDPGMIQQMGRILSGTARIRFATGGEAALRQLREAPADLVLLDAEMPGMSGFQVCEALKEDPALRDMPVIFVTGRSDQESELLGLETGAVDFIAKPISPPLLLARVRNQLHIKSLTDELRRLARVDALTGIANRRVFEETLEREWLHSHRMGQPIGLLMLDVDNFKRFNDRYGHPAGDACLTRVAQALQATCQRRTDLVARYGGEEFAILLPFTAVEGGLRQARQVLEAVRGLQIPHADSPTAAVVTISVGVGVCDPRELGGGALQLAGEAPPAERLIQCADAALYAAKEAGRDRLHLLKDGVDFQADLEEVVQIRAAGG